MAYDAIVTIGRIVRESGLDWTIVRLRSCRTVRAPHRSTRARWARRAACGCRAPTSPHSCWNRQPTRRTCTRRPSSATNDFRFRHALLRHRIAAGRVHWDLLDHVPVLGDAPSSMRRMSTTAYVGISPSAEPAVGVSGPSTIQFTPRVARRRPSRDQCGTARCRASDRNTCPAQRFPPG